MTYMDLKSRDCPVNVKMIRDEKMVRHKLQDQMPHVLCEDEPLPFIFAHPDLLQKMGS